jgi:adenylosuccinate lyase
MFSKIDLSQVVDASRFVGRAPQQVDEFLAEVVTPIRQRYADTLKYKAQLKV